MSPFSARFAAPLRARACVRLRSRSSQTFGITRLSYAYTQKEFVVRPPTPRYDSTMRCAVDAAALRNCATTIHADARPGTAVVLRVRRVLFL